MKPHPRIRKTVKWGGAVVTVLLVVANFGSILQNMGWTMPSGTTVGLWHARIYIVLPDSPTAKQIKTDLATTLHCWKSANGLFLYPSPNIWRVGFPLFIPAVLTIGLTITAWRLDTLARRRARLGNCPKCNYDRTGLALGAVCPECGQASTPA